MAAVLRYDQDADVGDLPTAPHKDIVHEPTTLQGRLADNVPYRLLTAVHIFRTYELRPVTPHLLCWHKLQYPACPMAVRGNNYAGHPAGWSALEVPFGATVPLPCYQAYVEKRLKSAKSMNEATLSLRGPSWRHSMWWSKCGRTTGCGCTRRASFTPCGLLGWT